MKRLLILPVLIISVVAGCGGGGPSCEERGGHVVVDGSHYQAPTYIMAGKVLIPVGGGMVTDSHCEVPK